MLLTIVGLLVVLVATWWVTWPLLSPGGGDAFGSVDAGPGLVAERTESELARDNALAAIRDAEFDHRLGKLTDDDYERLRGEQEVRALAAIEAIAAGRGPAEELSAVRTDAAGAARPAKERASRGGAAFCTSCGKATGGGRFCKACGREVASASRRGASNL